MLRIVTYPDPVLEQQCDDVVEFDTDLKRLVDDMAEAMYASHGVGLAAPQVGLSKNIILVDPSAGESGNQLVAMVNPRITWRGDDIEVGEEGCLSLPGVCLRVPRSVHVVVEYLDIEGQVHRLDCTTWQARIVQHEIDHLSGITILKRVGYLTRQMALKTLHRTGDGNRYLS